MVELLQSTKRARKLPSSPLSSSEKSIDTLSLPNKHKNVYISPDQGFQSMFISTEITALKTELEKERSLRRLEQIKTENTVSRLKRHVLSLEKDAEDSRTMAEEIRSQSLNDLERASQAHKRAIMDLRDCEKNLHRLEKQKGKSNEVKNDDDWGFILLERKNVLLEKRLLGLEEEATALRDRLKNSERRTFDKIQCYNNDEENDININKKKTPSKIEIDSDNCENLKMKATPEIMMELNQTRVKLSESERLIRQLKRSIDDHKKKTDEAIKYREIAQRSRLRVDAMEEELKSLRREREELHIVEVRWREFRKELLANETLLSFGKDEVKDKLDDDSNTPPEIMTIIARFQMLRNKECELIGLCSRLEAQLEASNQHINILEDKNSTLVAASEKWSLDKKLMEKNNVKIRKELDTIYAREDIWKREGDSLRSLLTTYKDIENRIKLSYTLNTCKGSKDVNKDTLSRDQDDANVRGLNIALQSARDEIKILKESYDILHKEKKSIEMKAKSFEVEHNRVLKKFGMIRDALFQERDKAERAEKKAVESEILVGKGYYNSETTRILHLEQNPLSTAINNKFIKEIVILKEALKEAQSRSVDEVGDINMIDIEVIPITTKVKERKSSLDAQKFNQRLKESFQKQIGLFREGVYLLTGFRIDMIAVDADRPRFRVRSMYSEQEKDYLLMQWPKLDEGEMPSSLDVLDTEMAQVLSIEPSCSEYMTKYKSLPAFMASVTLTLFEKQTFVEG